MSDVDDIIAGLVAKGAKAWPAWCTVPQDATTVAGTWTLSQRGRETSGIEDGAPADALPRWVQTYARYGNGHDPVRVRFRGGDGKERSWLLLGIPANEREKSGADRAAEMALQLLGDPQARGALMATIASGWAGPLAAVIGPVVRAELRGILGPETCGAECNSGFVRTEGMLCGKALGHDGAHKGTDTHGAGFEWSPVAAES